MTHNKYSAPAVNQANIDSVTAELGRHAGDVGEAKRLGALETLMKKRQSDAAYAALHGAKARRKKAPQSLLPR